MRAREVLPNFRIGVVGSGAIGSFYGAKLAYHGRDVHFLMRNDIAAVRKFGIHIRSKVGNIRVAKVNCYRSTDEIGPCDLVLIAIKTSSNTELLRLIPPLLHERTILLTLQNGFGNEEFLAQNFGADRILGGLCFVCLNRVAPGVIEHYDYGRISLGEYSRYPLPRTHNVAREFKRCGIVCSVGKNLALERWRKLVWNIPFNGLSVTAGGIDTVAILRDNNLRTVTLALMDEASTLIDFEARKPLEIEAIWGEPLRRATAVGAKMPRLELLYALLKERDRRNRLVTVPVDLSRKSVAAENVTRG
jgi:2-dehydropantoate 2-reductase